MISALTRASALPALASIATRRAPSIAFQAPLLPQGARALAGRAAPTQGTFTLKNFNSRENKNQILNFACLRYKRYIYDQIVLERSSVIADEKWVVELLTHIVKSGVQKVNVTVLSEQFIIPGKEEIANPTVEKVRKLEDRLMRIEGRPEILTLRDVRLTKERISALARTLAAGSHASRYHIALHY